MNKTSHIVAFAFAALITVFLSAYAYAAPVGNGDTIPHTLELQDKDGQMQSFDAVKGEKGAVLYFVRSADWCPYCQVQLLDIRDYGPELEAAGYNVVSISYDSPEKLKTFADKYRFPFTMLSDEGSKAIKAFGILDETKDPETRFYGIPHPTVYVVNADGTIKAKLAEETYKTRPKAKGILEAIK